MKHNISFCYSKKRSLGTASLSKVLGAFCPGKVLDAFCTGKILVALTLITLLFGCGTTAYNIKSARELSSNKLLTGRFVFFNDDVHIVNGEGFNVLFKEREAETLRMFQPDKKGYVYIPVDEGQYHISRIKYNKLNGHLLFPVQQNSGINVDASDTVVNFGTIQVDLQQNITSKIAYVSTYGYPYAGKLMPSSLKPELSISQIPDWNVTHQYILSSKLDILPETVRDEVVDFSEEVEIPFR